MSDNCSAALRAEPAVQRNATAATIEKVARAMALHVGWKKWDTAKNFNDTPDGSDPDDERDYWRSLAAAALNAAGK